MVFDLIYKDDQRENQCDSVGCCDRNVGSKKTEKKPQQCAESEQSVHGERDTRSITGPDRFNGLGKKRDRGAKSRCKAQ